MPTTRDLLLALARAERATADERWDEAANLWGMVVAANPVEGRYWLALGTAREQAGEFADAIDAYKRALDLRAGYPADTARDVARCYAQVGRTGESLDWLERSVRTGLRSLEGVRTDDRFASIRDHARYRPALGIAETDGVSRDDGWRFDLRFLVREIERRAYNPFLTVSRARFDQTVAGIERAIPTSSDAALVLAFQRLITLLDDGHARIRPPRDRAHLQRVVPVQFYLFEEGLYLTAASPVYAHLVGTRIEAFGGVPFADVREAFRPLLPRDNGNEQWIKETLPPRLRELATMHALGFTQDSDRLHCTLIDGHGERSEIAIDADPTRSADELREAFPYPTGWTYLPDTLDTPRPDYLQHPDLNYWFRHLPEHNLVYLQFNAVRDAPGEPFAALCDRVFGLLEDTPGARLVLDIRWNSGGNTALTHALLYRIIGSPRINQRGRLYVIIGRRTFSAAQNLTGLLDRHTKAIFVGEPTGSSPVFTGETVDFELPYTRIVANISDLRWVTTWPDDYRTWVAPTLYSPPTFAAFQENRDPAMEAILGDDVSYPLG